MVLMLTSRSSTLRRGRAGFHLARWVRLLPLAGMAMFVCGQLQAQDPDRHDPGRHDLDDDRLRLAGLYWFVQPSGSIFDLADSGRLPINLSTGFQSYSAPFVTADLRVARKHHLLLDLSPKIFSQGKTLLVQVNFQGNTYTAGTSVATKLRSFTYAPGYRYDFLKREQGHLGLVVQVHLISLRGSIQAMAQVSGPNGSSSAAYVASASKFLLLPVIGLDGKLFLIPGSDRLFVAAYGQGLPFFGYGNYVAGQGTVGVRLVSHLDAVGGYLLDGRLIVHGNPDRFAITLTQNGPVGGLQYSW